MDGANLHDDHQSTMKRIFDVALSLTILTILSPVLILCALAIRLSSKGPILHVSKRIGVNHGSFGMYKFRTMRVDTPQLATHLMTNPSLYVTPVGAILRKYSLDELPQLINVLKGDMSIVGPRPALFNQYDQIALRKAAGCDVLLPGVTGWAQINGRDNIPIDRKVELDTWYLHHRNFWLDIKIIVLTAWAALRGDDVTH